MATAVTVPLRSTRATAGFEDTKVKAFVRACCEPSLNNPVTVRTWTWPGELRDTDVGETAMLTSDFTVTEI